MFGFPNENWKEFRTHWGQVVLVPEKFVTTTDQDGALLIYPEGDKNAPPSARMPRESYFFDTIIRQEPFHEEELTPEANLEEFGLLSDEDLNYWKSQKEKITGTDKAVVAILENSLGDIALVPLPLRRTRKDPDISEWYMSCYAADQVRTIWTGKRI
jgi:hypothetical protein